MIRILATADWHLGNCFYGYDRQEEHADYLDWLLKTATERQADVLLVCGDVFDNSNPSAASQELFYSFLTRLSSALPDLQTFIIAGNHDSAMRLEAPKSLLIRHKVWVKGVVNKDDSGSVAYDQLLTTICSHDGEKATLLSIPYLRDGDFPRVKGCAEFLKEAVSAAEQIRGDGALIVMAHLYARGSEIAEDSSEKIVIGGSEMVNVSCLSDDVTLFLSGHIHRHQTIEGKDNWLYPGSALPMSFAERDYKHGAVYSTIDSGKLDGKPMFIEYSLQHPLLSLPDKPAPLKEVKKSLEKLPKKQSGDNDATEPYLEVKVLLDSPAFPGLNKQIEDMLEGKRVRFCKTAVSYLVKKVSDEIPQVASMDDLLSIDPMKIIRTMYLKNHGFEMSEELEKLASEAIEAAKTETE